jgi:uncharacterized heparinase superfamily protein
MLSFIRKGRVAMEMRVKPSETWYVNVCAQCAAQEKTCGRRLVIVQHGSEALAKAPLKIVD